MEHNHTHQRRTSRGFKRMKEEGREDEQREIARLGGKAAHEKGTAHQWTAEEARVAGAKGGKSKSRKREQDIRNDAGVGGFAALGEGII